ncbi:TPA: ead/Ea22-like family protein [Escherichia coli]|uniref:ead/Ea22-like family protein n=1 Tax=Escherichia coli TaxID=562 RepID=UPI000DD77B08|nr:ead/Ea22-like family protein [Escherichia coli]MDM1162264.1 ead/Ea22-like family protein [Escherichia coli]HDS4190144.1 ead/Ea22-like family protein [Escherichia coli]
MSEINYQALREAAEKATCGEWSLEYGDGRFDGDDALIHREVAGYIPICRIEGAHPESRFYEDFQMEQQANAEFIAAANPATVLALLDELETAKKRIAEQEAEPVSQTYKLNELSGNSPVTPDGWISCSERMPDDGQHVIILCDGAFVLYAQYRDGEFFDIVRNGDEFFETQSRNVTDWMRLPEPPQEVNRG